MLKEKVGENLLIGETVMCERCGQQVTGKKEKEAHKVECDEKVEEIVRREMEKENARKIGKEKTAKTAGKEDKEEGKGKAGPTDDSSKDDVAEKTTGAH